MEGDGRASAGGGNSRWSPTKEQINMLENLYKQGVRTPSAEQIQQITSRLRAFGHIQGKNVFYWFQNHKARQRQKQKQESNLAYFNRFLHNATPPYHVFPPYHPPSPNVVCGPYYLPQKDMDMGFNQQCPKELLPSGIMGRSWPMFTGTGGYEMVTSNYVYDIAKHSAAENITTRSCRTSSSNQQETLTLFPMHPTGISSGRSSTGNSSEDQCSAAAAAAGGTGFFDFFSAEQGSFANE